MVEGESLALEGPEGARGELVFWVVGGRVVVGVGVGVWPGVLEAAVWMCVCEPGRAAEWTGERYSRCSHTGRRRLGRMEEG